MNAGLSPVCQNLRQPSLIDFPGRLAAVLFLSGCNFNCGFCHNAGLKERRADRVSWDELAARCARFRDQWADGAVITGGEPTIDPELPELVRWLRGAGFAVKLDTNGARPDVLESLLPQLDYVALDIKCSPAGYPRLTGFREVDQIARSAALLRASARDYELRTTLIESFHTDPEVQAMRPLIEGARRYVIQPFLPRPDLPDPALRETPRTAPECLKRVADRVRGWVGELVVRGG